MDSQVFEGGVLVQAPFVTRELAAPWCGEGRLGRSPSHQGAFGRLSIILGVFFSAGKPATMPRPTLVACVHQLPRNHTALAACMRAPTCPACLSLCTC